jgi:hypothetical protein
VIQIANRLVADDDAGGAEQAEVVACSMPIMMNAAVHTLL